MDNITILGHELTTLDAMNSLRFMMTSTTSGRGLRGLSNVNDLGLLMT